MSEIHMSEDTALSASRGNTERGLIIARIASAFAAKDSSTVQDILRLVDGLSKALSSAECAERERQTKIARLPGSIEQDAPAVPIEEAVKQDKVICLCCGQSFTMLKRHLKAEHGLTEDDYRSMFALPDDMPLVAPSYSARKAEYARNAGLGKHSRDPESNRNE